MLFPPYRYVHLHVLLFPYRREVFILITIHYNNGNDSRSITIVPGNVVNNTELFESTMFDVIKQQLTSTRKYIDIATSDGRTLINKLNIGYVQYEHEVDLQALLNPTVYI